MKDDITFTCVACKHSVFGQSTGGKLQYTGYSTPHREEPKSYTKSVNIRS